MKNWRLEEAAPVIGLTLGTVRQYVSTGVIPAIYIGKKRFITDQTIERLCTEGLRDTTRPLKKTAKKSRPKK